jgi:hypothetical protein
VDEIAAHSDLCAVGVLLLRAIIHADLCIPDVMFAVVWDVLASDEMIVEHFKKHKTQKHMLI